MGDGAEFFFGAGVFLADQHLFQKGIKKPELDFQKSARFRHGPLDQGLSLNGGPQIERDRFGGDGRTSRRFQKSIGGDEFEIAGQGQIVLDDFGNFFRHPFGPPFTAHKRGDRNRHFFVGGLVDRDINPGLGGKRPEKTQCRKEKLFHGRYSCFKPGSKSIRNPSL